MFYSVFFSHSVSRPDLLRSCCEFIVNEHKREIAKSKVVCCVKEMSVYASFWRILGSFRLSFEFLFRNLLTMTLLSWGVNVAKPELYRKFPLSGYPTGSLLDLAGWSTYNRNIVAIRSLLAKPSRSAIATSTPCD
ncbi:hypothetical protein [Pantoea sp. CCBC3-3-1]|uniref:hypothetical protein n=1 Tax=Pantoea sp. CCBC3-3-1 TaxID=2490851 RepID=UPI0011BE0CB7|nr:hypothetical protein [Pantoea sp. CCBC3-3-1]